MCIGFAVTTEISVVELPFSFTEVEGEVTPAEPSPHAAEARESEAGEMGCLILGFHRFDCALLRLQGLLHCYV